MPGLENQPRWRRFQTMKMHEVAVEANTLFQSVFSRLKTTRIAKLLIIIICFVHSLDFANNGCVSSRR